MLRQIGRRFQCFVAGEQERGTDRQQILGVQFFHTQARPVAATIKNRHIDIVRQLGLSHINVQQGPIFSHSAMVLQAAIHGQGVALANNVMAQSEIEAGRLVCPFNDVLVSKNAFYLVCHDSQAELGKIAAFRQWILAKAASEQEKFRFRYEQ